MTAWAVTLTATGSTTTAAVRDTVTVALGVPVLGAVALGVAVALVARAVRRRREAARIPGE